jgi:hypothetical protein
VSTDPSGGNGLLMPTVGVVGDDPRHHTLFHTKTSLECIVNAMSDRDNHGCFAQTGKA